MTQQPGVIPLDSTGADALKPILSMDDLREIEKLLIEQRLAAHSTYEAIRLGASINPTAPAIQFLLNADPADTPLVISYQDFFANLTRTANLFHELGVGPSDVVSFLLPLLPQSFYTLFGAEAAGIANPVNPLLEPHQLVEILRAANTKVLVTFGPSEGADIWQKVEMIRDQLPALEHIVQVGGEPQPGTIDFDSGVARQPGDKLLSGRTISGGDTAAFFHTGGTTGTPKLVPHTHLNQVYQAWVCNRMLAGPAEDTLLFGLPLFHVGGALTQGISSLTIGACIVILSPVGWRNPNSVRNVWKLVEHFRPSVFGAVPTVLAAAASVPLEGADISSVTCSSGGGSAIPVAIGKNLGDLLQKPVLEVYGMTETSSVHTIAYRDWPVKLGSAGHAAPYSRVRIVKVDDDGQCVGDCGVDQIGVIAMAGPGVFSGYLNDEHNAGAFVEPGWVNSGDLGRLDSEGYLWITGRAKDLIIRGGHNIDPAGVEDVLFGHEAVALAAVVGQPDAYAGELPLAFVQLQPGATTTAEELLEVVRANTPERAAVPVEILVIDNVPLTGVGKVFKPELRWQAAQRVFSRDLEGVPGAGEQIQVGVAAHGTHGSLATVTVTGADKARHAVLQQQIDDALGAHVMNHETVFESAG